MVKDSEPIKSTRERLSNAIVVPFLLLALLCLVRMPDYDQQVHRYISGATASTMTLDFIDNNATSSTDYASFLSLAAKSTSQARTWLNKSFVEGTTGFLKFDHQNNSNDRNTVTYKSCCGLGHRLTRLEDAAHVALLYQAKLDIVWKDCGEGTFQRLFGPEPFLLGQESTYDTDDSVKYSWTFGNDVPGCYKINQMYPQRKDLCEKIEEGKSISSPKLYQELMDRYIYRDKIQSYVAEHFEGKLVIGMHVRAGNNETGDFTRKKRQIPDMNAFVKLNADRVRSMMIPDMPAVLFIATDTPSYIQAFRTELNDTMPVVEMEQPRAQEGAGVYFGEHGAKKPKGDECLNGWHAALQDMMLLASADIVFAPAYSSFTRTMPRVLALARSNRKKDDAFCEVWKQSRQGMVCYRSLQDFNEHPPPMKRRRHRY